MTFGVTTDQLSSLFDPKSLKNLQELGGVEGLATSLKADLTNGLASKPTGAAAVDLSRQESPTSQPATAQENQTLIPSATHGSEDVFSDRRIAFGVNLLPSPDPKSFLSFAWDAIHDVFLLVLLVAAFFEIAIGVYKIIDKNDSLALIDGAIIVLAVVLVGAVNDFKKQSQFRKLNDFSKSLTLTKVMRDAAQQQVPNDQLLVGDLVIVETGDVIPADGVYISGYNLETDESSLTGESNAIKKNSHKDPFMLSGTKVLDGVGKMLVTNVGPNSMNGRTLMNLRVDPEATPLQKKLGNLAGSIAIFGLSSAGAMLLVLLISYFTVLSPSEREGSNIANDLINVVISAVTLIVVAIPEGLPMAVTIALSHSTRKMLKDNNLVRHLAACETMGNATTICSDKTGTLTMNKMTVVKAMINNVPATLAQINGDYVSSKFSTEHSQQMVRMLAEALNINSTAIESVSKDGVMRFNGSKTEVALLEMTRNLGFPYSQDRANLKTVQVIPFNSSRKKMSTLLEKPVDITLEKNLGLEFSYSTMSTNADTTTSTNADTKRYYMYTKGASEIILKQCNYYIDETGTPIELDTKSRVKYEATINQYANDALRTISVAFTIITQKEYDDLMAQATESESSSLSFDNLNLTLMGIFGIEDPVRPEVPDAVRSCQKAGVKVKMVTGDNSATAKSIAKQCNILTEDGIVMEGPEFRKLSADEMLLIVPKLQVLARSSPQDKQILVQFLKTAGETVAVTGDGTNDAPALKAADVGFSMGIAGTEVAKEASDIVLLDDNFASLVKALIWGRSIYDSVRKFLQFQLTVNFSAVVITVVTSVVSTFTNSRKVPYSALTAIQLLWVNLIMDTFAALALATDPPTPQLLLRNPDRKSDPLISSLMIRQIVGQGIYQIIVCLAIYFVGAQGFGYEFSEISDETGIDFYTTTLVFNTFVMCQIFNEINSRSITQSKNVFSRILNNELFCVIFVGTSIVQVIIVQYGQTVFKTVLGGLDYRSWLICVGFGLGSLVVGFLIRLLPAPSQRIQEDSFLSEEADRIASIVLDEVDASKLPQNDKDNMSKQLWELAIKRTSQQIKVVNAFKSSVTADAFEAGVRAGAQVALASVAASSNRARVDDLWSRARTVKTQVSIIRAFGGRRYMNSLLPGDIENARSTSLSKLN